MYFDCVATEYIPQDVLNKIKDTSITHNIFRIQFYDSIICRFYCIAFTESILSCRNLFSHNDFQKTNKIIYKDFTDTYGKRKPMSLL